MPGREGVGAQDNYSLFHDIRGVADVRGVPLEIEAGADFAFFLYPRSATDDTTYLAHAAKGEVRGTSDRLIDALAEPPSIRQFFKTNA